MFSVEYVRMGGFRKQYWISQKPLSLISGWLLTLVLDNFRFHISGFFGRGWILINIDSDTAWIS